MTTIIEFTCESCGVTGTAEFGMDMNNVNTGGGINLDQPCPKCSGKLKAPAGNYKRDAATGRLERVGDFDPADKPF
jgi:hypothetical protein